MEGLRQDAVVLFVIGRALVLLEELADSPMVPHIFFGVACDEKFGHL